MLLKKSTLFSSILLLVSISAYPSSENPLPPFQDESFSFSIPTENERGEFIKSFLSSSKKFATQNLIDNIVELTDGYTLAQFMEVLIDITSTSKENALDQLTCLEKLEEVINKFDSDQTKQQKIARLKKMIHKLLFKPIPFDPDLFKRDIGLNDTNTHSLTESQRLKIVKEILHEHKKTASELLVHVIAEETANCNESDFKKLVTKIVKASESSSLDQDRYLGYPTPDERREAIEEVLWLAKKSAPENLIKDIIKLTDQYDIHTVKKLVKSMVKKAKTAPLDRLSCMETLGKAIDLFDEEEVKKIKFAQIEEIISRESSKTNSDHSVTIKKKN